MSRPTVCDLFAGCGGLSLGLEAAGLEPRWAVELDPHAAATYRASHPGVAAFQEDVRTFLQRVRDGDPAAPRPGEPDLLAGGPPCQGFSHNNRHRSQDDPRNSMVPLFLDAVELLRPGWVLMENVTGILTLEEGRVVREAEGRLEALGYRARVVVLQAGHYRTAQDRWRLFLFGARNGQGVPCPPDPRTRFPRTKLGVPACWRTAAVVGPVSDGPTLFDGCYPQLTVADCIGDVPADQAERRDDSVPYAQPPRTDYQRAMRRGADALFDHVGERLGPVQAARAAAVPKRPRAGWLDLPDHLKPRNLLRYGGRSHNNRFGRLWWEGHFATIVTKPEMYWGRYIHPEADRPLTIRECARAQGIPDRVRFHGPMTARFRQVGNAVPPPLAKCIGLEFLRAMGHPAEDDGEVL